MGKVTVRSGHLRGKEVWIVDRRLGGVRQRSFFATKGEAESLARDVRKDMQEIAEAWRDLTVDEKIRLVLVHREAQRRNLDLLKVVSTFEEKQPEPEPESNAPTLKAALVQLATAKLESGRARRYVEHLDGCLRRFARGREEAKIDRVTVAEVNAFLESVPPKSRQNYRAMVSTLFSFALRKRWVDESPVEKVEKMKRVDRPPAVFTPKEVETCLRWLVRERPRALAWFVLTTFCGLRPEEAAVTGWEQIHFGEGLVVVEAQSSKVRRRRIVYPMPMAMEWLRFAQVQGSELLVGRVRERGEGGHDAGALARHAPPALQGAGGSGAGGGVLGDSAGVNGFGSSLGAGICAGRSRRDRGRRASVCGLRGPARDNSRDAAVRARRRNGKRRRTERRECGVFSSAEIPAHPLRTSLCLLIYSG